MESSFLRRYATPLSFVTFVAAAATGVMLILDIGSRQVSELHEWMGLAFVAAMILHLVRNWRGVVAMLSAARSKAIVVGLGALAAVLIVGFAVGAQEEGRGPHYIMQRLASAPIGKLAPALGVTGEEAIARLERSGVAVEGPEQSLADIAAKQHERLPRLIEVVLAESDG